MGQHMNLLNSQVIVYHPGNTGVTNYIPLMVFISYKQLTGFYKQSTAILRPVGVVLMYNLEVNTWLFLYN